MTTAVAEQKIVPWWHCCPFLALSLDGKDCSSVDDCARQQLWQQHRRQCLGIIGHSLLAHATPSTAAA
jgi:hypothetical protein